MGVSGGRVMLLRRLLLVLLPVCFLCWVCFWLRIFVLIAFRYVIGVVGIGRPFLYAFSAYGLDGVDRALQILNVSTLDATAFWLCFCCEH